MSPCQPQRWQQQLAVETLDCGKRSGACEFMNLHALKDGSSRTIVFTGIVAPGAAPGRHGARVDFLLRPSFEISAGCDGKKFYSFCLQSIDAPSCSFLLLPTKPIPKLMRTTVSGSFAHSHYKTWVPCSLRFHTTPWRQSLSLPLSLSLSLSLHCLAVTSSP